MGSRIEIQSVKKRGFLRQLCEAAKKNSDTLHDTLVAAQAAVNSPTFQKGRIVLSQSGSGQSGSFIHMAGQEWTQDNIFGLCEEFLELLYFYTNLNTAAPLLPDDAQPASTDALFRAMITDDELAGVTSQLGDWTGLNVPSIGGVPAS